MSEKNDGGPAFPTDLRTEQGQNLTQEGMTLRQWYKGMIGSKLPFLPYINPEMVAKKCADVADAMIAEDEKASESKPDDPLIALAPEMLEVCEEMANLLSRVIYATSCPKYIRNDSEDMCQKLQSIIRKARGGEDDNL